VSEIKQIKYPAMRSDFKMSCSLNGRNRSVCAHKIGPVSLDAIRPYPDVNDQRTAAHGCLHRLAFEHGRMSHNDFQSLRGFVRRFIRRHLKPLSSSTDFDFEEWLLSTHYSESRKDQLRRSHDQIKGKPKTSVSSFVKMESYPEFKPARIISSRHDQFKTYTGPIFHKIEKEVYKLPWFVKKIPVSERAQYLYEKLHRSGSIYCETDYSRWESNFSSELMRACELQLYSYMLKNFPREKSIIYDTLLGVNKIWFPNHNIRCRVRATRMTGEMCTSLGNGFTNLMVFLWACHRQFISVDGVVEGDDGLFRLSNRLDLSWFQRLGLTIKLDYVNHFGEASFCGITCSTETLHTLRDPIKVLSKIGWTNSANFKYSTRRSIKLGLLRAKALSLLYEVPNCPVLGVLARRLIYLTDGINPVWDWDWFTWQAYSSLRSIGAHYQCGPYEATSADYEAIVSKFGLSLQEIVMLEREIADMTFEYGPSCLKIINDHLGVDCSFYANHYKFAGDIKHVIRDPSVKASSWTFTGPNLEYVEHF